MAQFDAPFDPDFDADNPYISEVPERFVADDTAEEIEMQEAWAEYLEDSYSDPVDLYGPDYYAEYPF
jgi:hypothetical protein